MAGRRRSRGPVAVDRGLRGQDRWRGALRGWLTGLLLGWLAGPAGAAVQVAAVVQPAVVPVGQSTTYCVEVMLPPGGGARPEVQASPPVVGEGLVSWSARYEAWRRVEGRWQYRCCWTLRADRPGRVVVGPGEVVVRFPSGERQRQATPAVRVTVTPAAGGRLVPEAAPPGPRGGATLPGPVAGGVPGWRWPAVVVWLGAGALLLGLTATRQRRDRAEVHGPAEALAAALAEVEPGPGEGCWAALAAAIYRYAAAVGGREEAGLTSAEALAALAAAGVSPAVQAAVATTLRRADAVRFAREPADPRAAADCLAGLRAALGEVGKDR